MADQSIIPKGYSISKYNPRGHFLKDSVSHGVFDEIDSVSHVFEEIDSVSHGVLKEINSLVKFTGEKIMWFDSIG